MGSASSESSWFQNALMKLGHPNPSIVIQAIRCPSSPTGSSSSQKDSLNSNNSTNNNSRNDPHREDADSMLCHLTLWLEDRVIRLW